MPPRPPEAEAEMRVVLMDLFGDPAKIGFYSILDEIVHMNSVLAG